MRSILFTAIVMACGAAIVTGIAMAGPDDGGDTITKTYDYSDFDRVSVGGVYDLDVEVGKNYSITLRANARDMSFVKISSEDGTLYLGQKKRDKDGKKRKRYKNNDGITAVITLPELNALKVSGVANGDVSGVDADDFDMSVSGVADVEISGKCNTLTARVSGVGELDAKDFKCKNTKVSLSGVGDVSIYASESVDVKASGVGGVDVYGKPSKVTKKKAKLTNIDIK